MGQTLNATLATAQDSQSRHPLLEIKSSSMAPEIPFVGQDLTTESLNEEKPSSVALSSGRLANLYILDGGYLKYVYTDVDRTVFTTVAVDIVSGNTVVDATLCEMANGNVAISYIDMDSSNYYLRTTVLTPTGAVVTAATTILTKPVADWMNAPSIKRLASGTYLLVFAYKTGSTYSIQKMTSANFATWSGPSECVVSGLSSSLRRDHPSLLQVTTGDVFLFFDYLESVSGTAELTNIYYSVSVDDGSSWGAAVKLTNYATYDKTGIHPVAVQYTASQMRVVFTEQQGSLKMDDTATGWLTGDDARNITFDPVMRKLYVANSRTGAGAKVLQNVVKIDVDSWTVDDCWDATTVPAFNTFFTTVGANAYSDQRGDRHLIPVMSGGVPRVISVLDGEYDTIKTYALDNSTTYGIVKNVNGVPDTPLISIVRVRVDYDAKRLYCLGYSGTRVVIGYIDIGGVGPEYTWTTIVDESGMYNDWQIAFMTYGRFEIWKDVDMMTLSSCDIFGGNNGFLTVYSLSTGSRIKHYTNALFAGFHRSGLKEHVLVGNKIYGSFSYQSTDQQQDRRGLMEINIDTDTVVYHRPSYATVDDYGLQGMVLTGDGYIIIATNLVSPKSGIVLYKMADNTWQSFTSANVPGLTPDARDEFNDVRYDPVTGTIFTNIQDNTFGWGGIIMFNRYGFIRRSMYLDGAFTTDWGFAAALPLVAGVFDYESSVVYEPGGSSLYNFWTNQRLLEKSIRWAKEIGEFSLSSFVLSGSDVSLKRSIDSSTNKLEFAVSHGHLFDPHNTFSLYSPILRKGRKITVRFGESISAVEYWHPAGTFIVTEGKIDYKRSEYPVMSVRAEDLRVFWDDIEVIATPHYEQFPEAIIEAIATNFGGMVSGDVDLPEFDNRYVVWHQWMDTSVKKMVDQICERFGYYPSIDVNNKLTARRISDSNATDHIYSDVTKIINFSPDDSFSNFINRVVVVGENRDGIEVIGAEERITSLSGTVGWWGGKKTIRVYFSDDMARACRHARLEAVLSVRNFNFRLGGGGESITFVDPYEKYIEVTIEVPDMVAIVVSLVAAIVALGISVAGVPAPPGIPGWVVLALTTLLSALFYVIASVASYQYTIWAQPVGRERLHIQATADDLEAQADIGRVIPKKIDDPLAITQDQCYQVAAHELMVVRLQRNRIKFSKTADLRDEEGDTLQVPHPHTAMPMKIFVSDLTRKYKKPVAPGQDGYFTDHIEGWVV